MATSYRDRLSSRTAPREVNDPLRCGHPAASRRSMNRHQIENLAVLGTDQPIDPGGRKRPAKGRRHRNRMDDVAQRAEADEEDAVHPWRVRRATTSRGRVVFLVADNDRAAAIGLHDALAPERSPRCSRDPCSALRASATATAARQFGR